MPVPLLITTTFESHDDAEKLSRVLLERRLIACARIAGPVSSSYWWQGRITSSEEYVLTMKSDDSQYRELERVILELHPYEVPEIVATVITHVSEGYHQWLEEELRR
jgi:periplasmic divalent cation tolerance protein